ncbi:MAG: hypothetical protein ACREC9_15080 [Methylocella sp.]
MALIGNSITSGTTVTIGKELVFDVPRAVYCMQISWTGTITTNPNPTVELQGTIDRKTWSRITDVALRGQPGSLFGGGGVNLPVVAIRAAIMGQHPFDPGVAITVDLAAA